MRLTAEEYEEKRALAEAEKQLGEQNGDAACPNCFGEKVNLSYRSLDPDSGARNCFGGVCPLCNGKGTVDAAWSRFVAWRMQLNVDNPMKLQELAKLARLDMQPLLDVVVYGNYAMVDAKSRLDELLRPVTIPDPNTAPALRPEDRSMEVRIGDVTTLLGSSAMPPLQVGGSKAEV